MSGYLSRQMLDPRWRRPVPKDGGGRFHQWVAAALRRGRRRKMAKAFHDIDDWVLFDIGLRRADIPRLVEELDDRELRMRPPARSAAAPNDVRDAFRTAA